MRDGRRRPNDDVKAMSFEQALEALEKIVDDLERGDVPLDQSIRIYERGEALKAHCDRLLKAAEDKVEKIRLSRDGKPVGRRAARPEMWKARADSQCEVRSLPCAATSRPLFNFEPPATDAEVRDAALQFVRKVSGSTKPSQRNEQAFDHAVDSDRGGGARTARFPGNHRSRRRTARRKPPRRAPGSVIRFALRRLR